MKSQSLPSAAGAAAHTPLKARTGRLSGPGLFIASVIASDGQTFAEVHGLTRDGASARAAFIVRACNSHTDLVVALQKLLDLTDAYRSAIMMSDSAHLLAEKSPRIEEARAALKAATQTLPE